MLVSRFPSECARHSRLPWDRWHIRSPLMGSGSQMITPMTVMSSEVWPKASLFFCAKINKNRFPLLAKHSRTENNSVLPIATTLITEWNKKWHSPFIPACVLWTGLVEQFSGLVESTGNWIPSYHLCYYNINGKMEVSCPWIPQGH